LAEAKFIRVHDPTGYLLVINVKAIAKVRQHPKTGSIIYFSNGVQHVKEDMETVLRMMQ